MLPYYEREYCTVFCSYLEVALSRHFVDEASAAVEVMTTTMTRPEMLEAVVAVVPAGEEGFPDASDIPQRSAVEAVTVMSAAGPL